MTTKTKTARQVKVEASNRPKHYGRIRDVQDQFGLSRGTVYTLLKAGKIRGCALRISGGRSRARLIDLDSVQAFVESQMSGQGKAVAS
jgi:transposase